jgi:hypothetical protein
MTFGSIQSRMNHINNSQIGTDMITKASRLIPNALNNGYGNGSSMATTTAIEALSRITFMATNPIVTMCVTVIGHATD